MPRFTKFVLDRFGTPDLSELTECGAPEMENPKNYLSAFVLNSLIVATYPEQMRRLTLMFGRRVEDAARQYILGRGKLLSYLERLPQSNEHFLGALRATTYFEHCVGAASHAEALFGSLINITDAQDPSYTSHLSL